jgi:hypothetical protein
VTILGKAISEPEPSGVRRFTCSKAPTERAQTEIERLTESLFVMKGYLHYKSALVMDLGGHTSSLWVATNIAEVLGRSLRNSVHVLAVGMDASEMQEASETKSNLSTGMCCLLEHIEYATSTATHEVLFERLPAIKADGRVAIVH